MSDLTAIVAVCSFSPAFNTVERQVLSVRRREWNSGVAAGTSVPGPKRRFLRAP
ncbi:MAG: hypothetical protein KatS3mg110_1816 [Pirellulaceae bacterium]|nr:MAG: hypothetical protein KatS3mg110_1816 [Pirellulaceae bacterium]